MTPQPTTLISSCLVFWAASMVAAAGQHPAQAGGEVRLEVIPQPQQVTFGGDGFDWSKAAVVRVSDTAADRFAAAQLRDALRAVCGIDCSVVPVTQGSVDHHQLLLSAADDTPVATPPVPSGNTVEGYALRINADGVGLVAPSDTGLFYGVQTLIQLVEQARRDGVGTPGMEIVDWPSFAARGRYFDGSQYFGTVVATRQNLEREIKRLARYKMNGLFIEVYNLVPFESFPYCANENTLSLADWIYLVELAHRHHVTIVPSLQSFAQIYDVIWKCDEGKPYREETAPGIICPSRPENVKFLQGLYADLMSVFRYSPYLGIGCSETDMQWQKRYCPRCQARIDGGESYYDIYYKHVNDCVKAVDAAAQECGRNVRPLMWADEFYMGYHGKRWIGIENIPKNVVMGHWQYWSHYQNMPDYTKTDYDGIRGLLERGYDILFVSASFEFNTYLHDLSPDEPKDGKWNLLYDAGIYNIADQAKWAYTHGQEVASGKVLGGFCCTFSQHDIRGWDTTWYAFALQGEYSWGDPTRPLAALKDSFTNAFAATFYGARDRETTNTIAAALRDLDAAKSDLERNNYLIRDFIGEYDIHDTSYNGNDLVKSLELIDELARNSQGQGKTIQIVRQRAEKVIEVATAYRSSLAALASKVDNTYSLGYLVSAAWKMDNHAKRTLYMLDQQAVLAQVTAANEPATRKRLTEEIDGLTRRLGALQHDTRMIADEADQLAFGSAFKPLWAENSDEGETGISADTLGYHRVLASLREFGKRLSEARSRLQ